MTATTNVDVHPKQLARPDVPVPPRPAVSESRGSRLGDVVARWGVVFGFAAMVLFFSIMRPDTFATWQNARNIFNASPIVIVFGCIVTTTMVMGEFDISFPNLTDLSSIILAVLVTTGGLTAGLSLAVAIALAIGAAVVAGSITGTLVASARVPSFVITLAMGSVAAGVELTVGDHLPNGQRQLSSLALPGGLQRIGTTTLGGSGLRLAVAIAAVVALATWFLLRRTVSGRRIHAIGGNPRAAELAAVPLRRLRFTVFVGAGLMAGMAGRSASQNADTSRQRRHLSCFRPIRRLSSERRFSDFGGSTSAARSWRSSSSRHSPAACP